MFSVLSSVEKDSCAYALFTLRKQYLHFVLFQTKFLDFLSVLPHEVICAFVFHPLLIAVRWSHTIPETQSFIKIASCIHIHLLA